MQQVTFRLPAQPIMARPVHLFGPAVEPVIEFIVNPEGIVPAANDEAKPQ